MADLLPSMASDEEVEVDANNDSESENDDENEMGEMDGSFEFGGILVS